LNGRSEIKRESISLFSKLNLNSDDNKVTESLNKDVENTIEAKGNRGSLININTNLFLQNKFKIKEKEDLEVIKDKEELKVEKIPVYEKEKDTSSKNRSSTKNNSGSIGGKFPPSNKSSAKDL
jgi:hypothetical protein